MCATGFLGSLVVETDSLVLHRTILKCHQCPWSISVEVVKAKLLAGGGCKITHYYREANKVVDTLANAGSAHPLHGVCVYENIAELLKMARGEYRLDKLRFPSFRRFRVTGVLPNM